MIFYSKFRFVDVNWFPAASGRLDLQIKKYKSEV